MTRTHLPPLRSMLALFGVKGVFSPSSVHASATALNCPGMLALAGGRQRKAIVAIERRTPASRGMLMTRRFSYGCGPARAADSPAVFYREIEAAIRPVLSRIAAREKAIARLWPGAARAWSAAGATLDLLEPDMGGRVSPEIIAAARRTAGPVLDIGVHLRSGCLQRCAFCRNEPLPYEPELWDDDLATVKDLVRRVVRPAARRGIDSRFRLEADDLAGHGRLDEVFGILSRETAFGIHLWVPPNRLADPRVAKRVAGLPALESVTLTLFGCTSRTHDAIAGRAGAFHELLRAAANLQAAGTVPLYFSAVLTAPGLDELAGIVDAAQAMRGRLILSALFADCPMHHDRLAAIVPDLAALRDALRPVERRILDRDVRLQDFPLCALPEGLRGRNDSKRVMHRDDYPALAVCAGCIHRPRCCGVPRGYLEAHGTRHLRPEKARADSPGSGRRRRPGAGGR